MENIQALHAVGVSQAVSTNNVANMNTDGFNPGRVDLETGPQDQGVRVQDIVTLSSEYPAKRPEEAPASDVDLPPSETDLATELVQMIENEHGFAANAVALRTAMDMTGAFIDTLV